MGLLSCLTHPSPVIRSQAPTGKVTKGCNLPSAECDSGTGRVRNTCEKPPSRSAGVSERWRNVSVGECEGQHPCQDQGGEKRRLERDLPSRHSFWTPPLPVRCYKREFWRLSWHWILFTPQKKPLVGPAVEQNQLFFYNSSKKLSRMMKPFTVWDGKRNVKKNVASDETRRDFLVGLNGFHSI